MKKTTNKKCWWGCRAKRTLEHCWWEYKLVQSPWKTVWQFPKKTDTRTTIWPSSFTPGYVSENKNKNKKKPLLCFCFLFYLLSFFFFFFGAVPTAYWGSQGRSRFRAVSTCLYHIHSNIRFEPHLQPTPQLMATLDP